MKHSTPPRGKCRRLILALMLLFSMTAAWADDSGLITQQITVNVATKGTLSNIIQSDKMFKITNLKITGELNSDDFTFIRKMAGCYYDSNRHKYDGHLEHLDLGEGYIAYRIPILKRFTMKTAIRKVYQTALYLYLIFTTSRPLSCQDLTETGTFHCWIAEA